MYIPWEASYRQRSECNDLYENKLELDSKSLFLLKNLLSSVSSLCFIFSINQLDFITINYNV